MPECFAILAVLTYRGFPVTYLELFIMKNERHTYEAFCRAFAGIYAKHAKNGGHYFTCYVRDAIAYYIGKDEIERGVLMETAGRESLVGYKIAYSLLKAGWDEDTILDYTDTQQGYVNEAERRLAFEDAVVHLYTFKTKPRFAITMNAFRHAWLIDGAPCLLEACEELIEAEARLRDEEEEDDHDDEE